MCGEITGNYHNNHEYSHFLYTMMYCGKIALEFNSAIAISGKLPGPSANILS